VVRRVGAMMAVAALLGALSVAGGLLLSYHYDLAAGATIVLVEVAVFFVTLAVQAIRRPALRAAPA
jgi:zinc/manganese transport system permease protein